MSYPLVAAMPENRTVRIDYPRLFKGGGNAAREAFLLRGFELEEVVSVEINRAIGSALVRFHPRCIAILDALARLAGKLGEARWQAFAPASPPYFVLQEEDERIVYSKAPPIAPGVRRLVYGGLGVLFFGLSLVGVAAPLIPTTPFVILSSYFALRSSPALNERLLRSRLFGRILDDWHKHRAMRRSTRRRVLVFMVAVFALTFGLVPPSAAALPLALLIALLSFGFVLQMPVVENGPPLAEVRPAKALLPNWELSRPINPRGTL